MVDVPVLFVPLMSTGLVERTGADGLTVGVAVGDALAVGEAVAVGAALGVGDAVADGAELAVGDAVAIGIVLAVDVGVGVGVGETVGDALAVAVAVAVGDGLTVAVAVGDGETVGDDVGVGVDVGVVGAGVVGAGALPLEPPCPTSAAIRPTPAMPPTTSAVLLFAAAGKTVPSAITSWAIAHVNVSVPGGSVCFSYGGVRSIFPSDALLLSKNENVTVDDFTIALESNAICGVKLPSTTTASHETILPGAVGCAATTPGSVVDVWARALCWVAEPTMPTTASATKTRR
jgi:hypothetical protein